MIDDRLIVLLDAYLDGSLDPEEKQELERMLLESDEARREFWKRSSLHGWTYAAAKLNYSAQPAAEASRERRGLHGPSIEILLGWFRRAARFGLKTALIGAACALALLAWFGIRSLVRQPLDDDELTESTPEQAPLTNIIATLTAGTGVVWERGSNSAEIGSMLSPGWLQLKSGAVQIQFNTGARVILQGPAALELISPGEARLRFGKLSARVPEPAHGFKVYTSGATVTDLGTEFGVNEPLSLPEQVEVFEGKIQLATDGESQPRLLNAGEAVQVSSHRVQPAPAAGRSAYLSAEELAKLEVAELRTRYQAWKQADHSLDKDPAMLVHLDFEEPRNVDRNLPNFASGKRASGRAMILGCDWAEGRWPGKGALEFNNWNDRVRFSVPGEFQSLTYMAWVRVDSLPNEWNALALVDTFKTGETHWQIHKDGRIELSVRPQGGKAGWDRLLSPPVVTRQQFGRWIHLAGVYDGRTSTMSLYFNGEKIASQKWSRRQTLSLGTMELGNWSPTAKKANANYRIRDFHGRMDEFNLLSRPFSDEEIRRQFELGRPREIVAVERLAASSAVTP